MRKSKDRQRILPPPPAPRPITIAREGEQVVVDVRSKSRIGKGDLGANARRIRAFQTELAKRF